MSATPTDDALIVALDFEGRTAGSRFSLPELTISLHLRC
jgi:hypothetical protein